MTHKHSSLARGNLASTPITLYSPQQEFAQVEWMSPTNPPASGYDGFSSSEKISGVTAATQPTPKYRNTLCRNYTFKGRCSFGASCRFIHDRAESIVLDQPIRQGDPAPRFDDGGQGMCRCERGNMRRQPDHEDPTPYIQYVPRRSGDGCGRGAFWPFNYPEASSSPSSQPNLNFLPTLSVTDPLAFDSDARLGGEGQYDLIEAFSVTKIPLSFNSHAVKVGLPEEGTWSHLFAPRPCPPPPSFLQSCSAGEFDIPSPQHVESPTITVSSITSSDLQSSIVPASPRSNPLKDLVDELPPFPFVRSTLSAIQKTEMRSMTYEDLLISAREETTLRRRKSLSCF